MLLLLLKIYLQVVLTTNGEAGFKRQFINTMEARKEWSRKTKIWNTELSGNKLGRLVFTVLSDPRHSSSNVTWGTDVHFSGHLKSSRTVMFNYCPKLFYFWHIGTKSDFLEGHPNPGALQQSPGDHTSALVWVRVGQFSLTLQKRAQICWVFPPAVPMPHLQKELHWQVMAVLRILFPNSSTHLTNC